MNVAKNSIIDNYLFNIFFDRCDVFSDSEKIGQQYYFSV